MLLGFSWHLARENGLLRADIRGAWRLIGEYDFVRDRLDKMSVNECLGLLQVYPHASLASSDPFLNKILERERARIIRDIIESLRKKTGEDLGDEPEKWIHNYDYGGLKERHLRPK